MTDFIHQQPTTLLENFINTYNSPKPIARIASIIGPSGSGKSHLTEQIAKKYGYTIRVVPLNGRDPTKGIVDALTSKNVTNDRLLIVIHRGEKLKKKHIEEILKKSILYLHPLIIHSYTKIQVPYEKIHMVWQVQIPALSPYDVEQYVKGLEDPTVLEQIDRFREAKLIGDLVKAVDLYNHAGQSEIPEWEQNELKRAIEQIRCGMKIRMPFTQLNHRLINAVDLDQVDIVAEADKHNRHSEYWGRRILRYLVIR